MNRLFLFLSLALIAGSAAAQQAPPPAPQKPKVVVQTPFGPREYDADQVPVGAVVITPAPSAPSQPQVVPAVPSPATPPAQSVPAPTQTSGAAAPQDEVVPFELHLDNQDIYQVIRIIADYLKMNYIIDPSVKGTVNISTSATLRRSDLLPILETILKINAATMIQTGNFYQIVPVTGATRQPLEVLERSAAPVAPDDQIVLQIIRMKFVSAAEMVRLLTPYVGEGASIVAQEQGNILLVADRRSNLRKLLEIVDLFDANVFEGQRVRLYPVKNNLAKDLLVDLKNVFAGYALSDASAVKFVNIDRLNSILVVTPNQLVFPEVERWLDRLDQPTQTSGRQNHVYKVRNGKAENIQMILAQLYGTQMQVSNVYSTPTGGAPLSPGQGAPTTAGQPSSPFAPAATPAAVQQLAVQAGNVRIFADLVNNAIVVQATAQEYAEIERTIEELDMLPRQVLIDAQVYEVALDDSISFGLSAILQNRGTLTGPQNTASFAGTAPSLTAQALAYVGRAHELVTFLNAKENRTRVKTLSAPSVLVSDNAQADFTVGADVPIPTTSSITPVQSSGTNLFAQTIEFRSTGVILKVKPRINESGNVTLEINQEVSQAAANTTSAVVAPVISKSSVLSTVVVQDSETIAIGGFIRENNEVDRSRLPLLGRIPVIGTLFGNTTHDNSRTELIILITPHVLKTHEDADLATEELKSKLREIQKLLK